MSEIADRVGVRKASLYNYYPSKADLLMDLLGRSLEAWEAASRPVLEGPGSVEDRLRAFLQMAIAFAEANPQAIGIWRVASTQVGGELRSRVSDFLAEHEKDAKCRVLEFFEEAVETGEVDPAAPQDLTLFLGTFLHGLLVSQIFAGGEEQDIHDRLPELWRFFWRGISGREPQMEFAR